jgi:hypothetical protein
MPAEASAITIECSLCFAGELTIQSASRISIRNEKKVRFRFPKTAGRERLQLAGLRQSRRCQ